MQAEPGSQLGTGIAQALPGSQLGTGIALEITIVLWFGTAAALILDVKFVARAPAKTRVTTETRTKSFMMRLPRINFLLCTAVHPNKTEYILSTA
jgi:hypothetical protein